MNPDDPEFARLCADEFLEHLDRRSGRVPSFEEEDELTAQIYRAAIEAGEADGLVDPNWPENMADLLYSEATERGGQDHHLAVHWTPHHPIGTPEHIICERVKSYFKGIASEEWEKASRKGAAYRELRRTLLSATYSHYLQRLEEVKKQETSEETALAIGEHALARTAPVSVEPRTVKWGLMGAGAFVVSLTSPFWVLAVVLALFLAMWSLETKPESQEDPDG